MLGTLLILSLLSTAPVTLAASLDNVPAAVPVYAGVAVVDPNVDVPITTPVSPPGTPKPTGTPLFSINTDVLDMSWLSAMDMADPAILRPTGIVLPFLESYPLDNFEVKLHLLNLRF